MAGDVCVLGLVARVEVTALETGELCQARQVVDFDAATAQRAQLPFAKLSHDAVDVDRGQAERVGAMWNGAPFSRRPRVLMHKDFSCGDGRHGIRTHCTRGDTWRNCLRRLLRAGA